MQRLAQSLPYLAATAVGYLVPVAFHPLLGESSDGKALVFGSLLFINPLLTAAVAALFTRRHGAQWWFPLTVAALFLPIALIPPLNSSAFVYALLYLVTAGLGVAVVWLLKGRRTSGTDDTTSDTKDSDTDDTTNTNNTNGTQETPSTTAS